MARSPRYVTDSQARQMLRSITQSQSRANLIAEMKSVAGRKLTADEVLDQTVSWIYGNMPDDSGVSREQVRKLVLEGRGL